MKFIILFLISSLVFAQVETKQKEVCFIPSDEIYFSPKGGCEHAVVDLINNTKQELEIAVYSINNSEIAKAIINAQYRGVHVRVLTDHVQAASNAATTMLLISKGVELRVNSVNKIMHNKLGIFDHKAVITGSFNWTNPAQNNNAENCIVLRGEPENLSIKKYEGQFNDVLWPENTKEKSDVHIAAIKTRVKKGK